MAKRPRLAADVPLEPEDITVGLAVVFDGGKQGFVTDAFAPLDQFWVRDAATGDVVRGEDGDIVAFSSKELRLVKPPTAPNGEGSTSARVLIIGTEKHMVQIIQHFGAPDTAQRREPQMILALPASSCSCGPRCARFDPDKMATCDTAKCPLVQQASVGVGDIPGMRDLAERLRPDLAAKGKMGIRPYHLKHALEQIGPDLQRLDGYYCLSSITMPFSWRDVDASVGEEKRLREEVHCQIDIGVTAEGISIGGEASLDRTAKRVLGEACGISLSEVIWEDEVQFRLRKELGVDLPTKYWDGQDTKGYVILLPKDLDAVPENGMLALRVPAGASYVPAAAGGRPAAPPAALDPMSQVVGGKSINEWKAEQYQFSHLPKLPAGWIRIRARSTGQVYFYNTRTQASQFDHPLPEGWTREVSKSTGKAYYFNAKKRKSMFEIPTE